MKLFILIPTYNEVHNIEKILQKVAYEVRKIKNLKTSVYVIDDSSPDGTALQSKKMASSLKAKEFEIKTLIKKRRRA
jgi:glycosyltransferase involved in cell wall biosynthesis